MSNLVLWRKPPEVEEHERKLIETRKAEADARLALAESRKKQAELRRVGTELVLSQLEKYLRLSQSPDFQNAIGPIEPAAVLKLLDFVTKEYRLDTGQATENIAATIGPSIDFSKLTQEERDQWRALVVKGQGRDVGE